ncbi:D-alanyl-D-alanine carboxypeptidase/D-alanyl-D-alanine-endopeptidase [bacterium]|nr:D-alanyl-D-alanine carboxypeptidase/D-alanyl-D-alanine-endopeptidase [bacterium]MBP9811254.1 D-alanyl-D-alanine carboxypeptidase/D-alanyl-D-alanine-endopeptidase [bacterium]
MKKAALSLLALTSLFLTVPQTTEAKPSQVIDCASACRSWLGRADLLHSRVGVEVMELPSGKVVFESDGSRRSTPASTAKVITTSCIYDTLGPNYVYHTRLVSNGFMNGTVLKGDLILETSQDPSLSRSDLMTLVKDAGITLVEGKVLVSCPPEGHDNYAVSWLAEDFGQDWMPVSSNLVIDRNIAFISGLPKQLRVADSRGSGLAILETLMQSGIGTAWLSLDSSSNIVTISRGTAYGSNGKIDSSIKKDGPYVVANPDAYNTAIFQSILNDHHVKTSMQAMVTKENLKEGMKDGTQEGLNNYRTVLAVHSSKPLSQIIRLCLHESDNLYAQQLLRTIALSDISKAKTVKSSHKSSRVETRTLEERGLLKVGEWLSSLGVPGREVVLFDGCGLSRKDCITPHALNLVLKHMAAEADSAPYLELLRASGEGSNSYRFKTGAMDTVRAISGILVNNFNQTEAVTIMINGHTPSVKELRIALSDLIERLKRSPISRPKVSSIANSSTSSKAPHNSADTKTSSAKLSPSALKKTSTQRRHHH